MDIYLILVCVLAYRIDLVYVLHRVGLGLEEVFAYKRFKCLCLYPAIDSKRLSL